MQTSALSWPQVGLPRLPEFPQFILPGTAAGAENCFPSAGGIQQQEDLYKITFLRTSKDYQVIITPLEVYYCGYYEQPQHRRILSTVVKAERQLQSLGHTPVKLSTERCFSFSFLPTNFPAWESPNLLCSPNPPAWVWSSYAL